MRRLVAASGMFACAIAAGNSALAQDITLSTNASGITISGASPSWSTGFGSVNGFGLGTPGSGQTVLSPSGGGVLYTSPYNIVVSLATAVTPAVVKAYVSTNFAHSTVLQVYSCVSSCTSGGS